MSADLFLLMQDYLKKKKSLSELMLRVGRDGLSEVNAEYQRHKREVEKARETFTVACREG